MDRQPAGPAEVLAVQSTDALPAMPETGHCLCGQVPYFVPSGIIGRAGQLPLPALRATVQDVGGTMAPPALFVAGWGRGAGTSAVKRDCVVDLEPAPHGIGSERVGLSPFKRRQLRASNKHSVGKRCPNRLHETAGEFGLVHAASAEPVDHHSALRYHAPRAGPRLFQEAPVTLLVLVTIVLGDRTISRPRRVAQEPKPEPLILLESRHVEIGRGRHNSAHTTCDLRQRGRALPNVGKSDRPDRAGWFAQS